ncbi:rhomboid protease ROM7, putative [Plasmodium gallinaceum]|uniref:Rhomboid protease ROM7, putative n=1 Tax=Plasmodium gallinaceum TaxID=5849 RepID=A0A1J1GSB4_PLAGA|nr:rhomboid protease ROM7, putative [Plasmodium gallinaceum]CRG93939.1 rhomboid protease ROM7, putative [Plasmodium gallinaceum]
MNIVILFFFSLYFLRGNSFHHNKIIYKKINTDNKSIIFKNKHKFYLLKKEKNINQLYSIRSPISNLLNNLNPTNVRRIIEVVPFDKIKNVFHGYFSYYNSLFKKCKLDRIIIALNTLLYLYLNQVDKNKEKKIFFHKGSLLEVKDEQRCEKYKCNYNDIYKNRNYKTFFTSIFIHKNILHLYFNMSSLISIYRLISLIYTNNQILIVFLLSGFLSNVFSYIYDMKQKNKNVFLKDVVDQNYVNKNYFINRSNKITCGSSSSIYSLYGMHITYIIFFYFKNRYIINTNFIYNFFYSFITSLLLENVSHFNHIFGFLCGSLFSFFIILFDKN